ncbi:hypothetical protein [Edaphobacter aggregans]|uniref:hypothetical protein n=1 Tax=Edaphobacter aggregans TaxID=570835 RepID=UPI000554932E|nr:hypothetical protein [Edaphobacter aggregans]
MRLKLLVGLLLSISLTAHSEDNVSRVRKAIERSTLDQPKTPPFHLKATLVPSLERDRASNRTGTIEIWWASPTQWKRDLAVAGFRLIEITDGSRHWQHTEGDYFPEWLREISIALIEPVPNRDAVLAKVKTAEVHSILGTTHFSWMEFSSNGDTTKAMGAGITINDNSGLLAHGGGFDWDFQNKSYSAFHSLLIARIVSASGGSDPEVTATITTLEDLNPVAQDIFDTTQPGSDPNPLRTVPIDEATLRKKLLPTAPPIWPTLKDGPLEGVTTTTVVVDRNGQVHDIGFMVSDNPGTNAAAHDYIASIRFEPFLLNREPVQAYSRITMPFKTTRPPGEDSFDSARNYFEHGRRLISPSAGTTASPYVLHATFEAGTKNGVQQGQYSDTWNSDAQWCREATFDNSHFSRCRNGDKWYLFSKGEHAPLLQIVLKAIEPIPATDTFVESDWRIDRKTIDNVSLIRVATGHESAEGTLDGQSRGLWFNSDGLLIRSHFRGLDTVQSQFQDFRGVQVPRLIGVLSDGKLAVRISITSIEATQPAPSSSFTLSGHDWKRQFTDEAR